MTGSLFTLPTPQHWLGTAGCPSATRALLLGAGELGKEIAIELQRLGIEVHTADRYPHAPAMQVAHHAHVLNMQDGAALHALVESIAPHFLIPEIEALDTRVLAALEQAGVNVVPCARATHLTMQREGIRRLVAEELRLPTSPYRFVDSLPDLQAAVAAIGLPCVVKPVMSSSGKGQSVLRTLDDIAPAWAHAQHGARGHGERVIVEGFIAFDYEITQLTVRAVDGLHFCAPIGHVQQDGDYRASWQPQQMSPEALAKAQTIAGTVVEALGGYGLFGVELFIKGDEVWFNEVSPRPHDTGLVTLVSQDLSQFALHVRAILGWPIGHIRQLAPSASAAILGQGDSNDLRYGHVAQALSGVPGGQVRLFAKPEISGRRRLGVTLCQGQDSHAARRDAEAMAECITLHY
ncbi:MAG: formate-dependent phosphoribosylglycinamide formyltransferase [Aeromonas sp.]